MIIGICDDEKKECSRLEGYLKSIPELMEIDADIYVFEPEDLRNMLDRDISDDKGYKVEDTDKINADKAEAEIDAPDQVKDDVAIPASELDVMIMDIEFKDKDYDGITLTKKLNEINEECQVIYLTHILEFAPEVYDTDHCYFVMKNNMELMLPRAIDKTMKIYKARSLQKPLEVMSGGHVVYIPQHDIRYVEKKQRQTIIHTEHSSYTCYESISALSKRLGDNMIRCHGGYIVNLSHITYFGGEKVVLDVSDMEVPVGKTYKEQAKQAYLKYWMNRM